MTSNPLLFSNYLILYFFATILLSSIFRKVNVERDFDEMIGGIRVHVTPPQSVIAVPYHSREWHRHDKSMLAGLSILSPSKSIQALNSGFLDAFIRSSLEASGGSL